MERLLSSKDIETLRQLKIITEEEVVLQEGEVYIAENLHTKIRRQVSVQNVMLESSRRLLRD